MLCNLLWGWAHSGRLVLGIHIAESNAIDETTLNSRFPNFPQLKTRKHMKHAHLTVWVSCSPSFFFFLTFWAPFPDNISYLHCTFRTLSLSGTTSFNFSSHTTVWGWGWKRVYGSCPMEGLKAPIPVTTIISYIKCTKSAGPNGNTPTWFSLPSGPARVLYTSRTDACRMPQG